MIWLVALEVTGPDDVVALDEEIEAPAERVVRAPDGRTLLGIYAARFDRSRGILELVAGPERGGRPVARVARSDELDPYRPFAATLERRGQRWTVSATLGVRYAPPPAEAGACGDALRADLADGTGWTVPAAAIEGGVARIGGLSFAVGAGEPTSAASSPSGDAPFALAPGVIGRTALGEVRWDGPAPIAIVGLSGARDPIATVRVDCAEVRLRPERGAIVDASGPAQ